MKLSSNLTPNNVYYKTSSFSLKKNQFQQIDLESTFLNSQETKIKSLSYDDMEEFDNFLKKHNFIKTRYLYERVIKDSRVLQKDDILELRIQEYYNEVMYNNFYNLYVNSPAFFSKLFTIDNKYKQYQLYIYCLCFIKYILTNHNTSDFQDLKHHEQYYSWVLNKNDPNIDSILEGPKTSTNIVFDFIKHYNSIMNPENVEGDITEYLQLATQQQISKELIKMHEYIENVPNVFDKVPDQARQYSIILDSMNVSNKYIDNDNNFIIDLENEDFGDVSDENIPAKFEDIDKIKERQTYSSRLTIKKLQELLNIYDRIKVENFTVPKNVYKIG